MHAESTKCKNHGVVLYSTVQDARSVTKRSLLSWKVRQAEAGFFQLGRLDETQKFAGHPPCHFLKFKETTVFVKHWSTQVVDVEG